MKFNYVVAEDVALNDVKDFVEFFKGLEQTEDEIKSNFIYTLRAVRLGLLTFDDQMVPTLKLEVPIKGESGDNAITEIKFKTRLTAADAKRIYADPEVKKNNAVATLKGRAYMINQPAAILDKLGRFDEKAIIEIVDLFL